MRRAALGLLLLAVALSPGAASANPTDETPTDTGATSDYALGKKLLGCAYRNAGRFDEAFRHYRAALRLNPRHRGAHEYIGEAYLLVSEDLEKAIAR
jgi:tetratricopeptide (TPR) repeat protein